MEQTEERKTITVAEFCRQHGITAQADPVESRPDSDPKDGEHEQDHYKVSLSRGRSKMSLFYSMGIGVGRSKSHTSTAISPRRTSPSAHGVRRKP